MTFPDPNDQLSEIFSERVRHVLKALSQIEAENGRAHINKLIITIDDLEPVLHSVLLKYNLPEVLDDFCQRLDNSLKETQVSLSSSGCNQIIPLELKKRLYLIITYLCGHVIERQSHFILLGLSIEDAKLTFTMDTDVPFLNTIDHAEDIALQPALDHIRKMNGKLKGEYIQLNQRVFRLTLTVGIDKLEEVKE